MKNAWKKLTEIIKNEDYTTREAVLAGIILFLFGIIVGAVFTPKKHTCIGSNNGSHNDGNFGVADDKKEDNKKKLA